MTTRQRHIAHFHLHTALTGTQYDDVIELVSGITPHVQAIPPNALQVDLTSALRYFDMSAYDAVQTVKMRLKAHYGIDSSAGLAGNRMLAAMAADASAPGTPLWCPPDRRPTGCTPGRSPRCPGSAAPRRTRCTGTGCTPSASSPTCRPRPCNGSSARARHGC